MCGPGTAEDPALNHMLKCQLRRSPLIEQVVEIGPHDCAGVPDDVDGSFALEVVGKRQLVGLHKEGLVLRRQLLPHGFGEDLAAVAHQAVQLLVLIVGMGILVEERLERAILADDQVVISKVIVPID